MLANSRGRTMNKSIVANALKRMARVLTAGNTFSMYCQDSLFTIAAAIPFARIVGLDTGKFRDGIGILERQLLDRAKAFLSEASKAGYEYVRLNREEARVLFKDNCLCLIVGGNLHAAQDNIVLSEICGKARIEFFPRQF